MSIQKNTKILCFIKANKLKQNGEAPVFVRITYDNTRTEFGIRESIDPKLWNKEKERAKGNSKNAKRINELLTSAMQHPKNYFGRFRTVPVAVRPFPIASSLCVLSRVTDRLFDTYCV